VMVDAEKKRRRHADKETRRSIERILKTFKAEVARMDKRILERSPVYSWTAA